ncbi:MAG: HU family DNA-binding protein [Clostridia bacterium]|nr:HU family DNA-binding protein [Clostridia bacterium]
MNKSEFVRAYADKLGVTIKEAEANFAAFKETLTDVLSTGEYVHISGFATFELKDKDARNGINPKTGDKVAIPACKTPVAKFSKSYKEIFNK